MADPTADIPAKPSSGALIAIAWLIVILPAAWGLEHTVQNAIKIFTKPSPPVSAPATTSGGQAH